MENITIDLSTAEVLVLKKLLYAEYNTYSDRVAHAASHGDEYSDVHGISVQRIIEKIERG